MSYGGSYFRTRFVFDAKRDRVWKEICRFLQERYVPAQSKILDIGAGYCEFINNIHGREKHALDTYGKMPEYAGRDVITHVQSSTAMDTFEDGLFDTVFSSNLFEHLTREELSRTLREIRRVLRGGGKLIVIQPNFKYCYMEYFDDYTHLQVFTHIALCDLLETYGFGIVYVEPRFVPFSMKANLPKFPLLIRLYLRSRIRPLAGQMLIVAEKEE